MSGRSIRRGSSSSLLWKKFIEQASINGEDEVDISLILDPTRSQVDDTECQEVIDELLESISRFSETEEGERIRRVAEQDNYALRTSRLAIIVQQFLSALQYVKEKLVVLFTYLWNVLKGVATRSIELARVFYNRCKQVISEKVDNIVDDVGGWANFRKRFFIGAATGLAVFAAIDLALVTLLTAPVSIPVLVGGAVASAVVGGVVAVYI